jgi:hypothetical protein
MPPHIFRLIGNRNRNTTWWAESGGERTGYLPEGKKRYNNESLKELREIIV